MKSENFCFWLQGFFELGSGSKLTAEQVAQIKTHLALVFKHDPAMAHPAAPKSDVVKELERQIGRARPTMYC